MKKTLVILGLCVLINQNGQEVVTDPLVLQAMERLNAVQSQQTITQTSMSSTLTGMEQAQKAAEKAVRTVDNVKSLKTVFSLFKMIENTICTYKNLQISISGSTYLSYCGFNFHFQTQMVKIDAALDFLKLAVNQNVSLDQTGRNDAISKSLKLFDEANRGLLSLSNIINAEKYRASLNKQVTSDTKTFLLLTRYR